IQSDRAIYLCVIKALSDIGDYSKSELFIKEIPDCFLLDYQIKNALIDMWGKTACINRAEKVFNEISEPNHVAWTAMINSYVLNGMGIQAVELYHKMPSEFINEMTNICVLNACSHSGLVSEARLIFKNIQIKTDRIYNTKINSTI
ncbi:unnamed protein product, partial [Rotaria sp. Silwood1]